METGPNATQNKVNHLFRHEAGNLTAYLLKVLGVHNLAIAEEIVQDTLLKALQVWPYHPPLEKPEAWLWRVAKNKALDHLRQTARHAQLLQKSPFYLPPMNTGAHGWLPNTTDHPLKDDLLCMVFLCCDKRLFPPDQVALCLQLVGGLSAKEVAAAFMVPHDTMRKRLYRAKQTIKKGPRKLQLPPPQDLGQKLDAVHAVLYLMFNEGYFSQNDEQFIRKDLINEAMRLCKLLLDNPQFRDSRTYAMAALMSFQAARLSTRIDQEGEMLLLEFQDRSQWNQALIAKGFQLLEVSRKIKKTNEPLCAYHLEAGIAAIHITAPNYQQTNWPRILECYNLLLKLNPSPMVRLNRCIVIGQIHGPEAASHELSTLEELDGLKHHYLLWATKANMAFKSQQYAQAKAFFTTAHNLAPSVPQKRFFLKKLAACKRELKGLPL